MVKVIMNVSMEWERLPSDFKPCYRCGDLITGDMHIPIVTIGKPEDLDYSEIKIKLCTPCYELKILNRE